MANLLLPERNFAKNREALPSSRSTETVVPVIAVRRSACEFPINALYAHYAGSVPYKFSTRVGSDPGKRVRFSSEIDLLVRMRTPKSQRLSAG